MDSSGAAVGLFLDDAVADRHAHGVGIERAAQDGTGNLDAVTNRIELVASRRKDFLVDHARVVGVESVLHSAPGCSVCLLAILSVDSVCVKEQNRREVDHRSEALHVVHCHRASGELHLDREFYVAEGFFDCVDFFLITDELLSAPALVILLARFFVFCHSG